MATFATRFGTLIGNTGFFSRNKKGKRQENITGTIRAKKIPALKGQRTKTTTIVFGKNVQAKKINLQTGKTRLGKFKFKVFRQAKITSRFN